MLHQFSLRHITMSITKSFSESFIICILLGLCVFTTWEVIKNSYPAGCSNGPKFRKIVVPVAQPIVPINCFQPWRNTIRCLRSLNYPQTQQQGSKRKLSATKQHRKRIMFQGSHTNWKISIISAIFLLIVIILSFFTIID